MTEAELTAIERTYEAGYDCGLHGPNATNCDYRWFSTREDTREWERGKAEAEREKPRRSA